MLHTYSLGMTPKEVIEGCLQPKTRLELNKADMLIVLDALDQAAIELNLADNVSPNPPLDLRVSILASIGIEEV